ncbi:MAG: hypothetical protein M3548_16615 [Actinomycetota bacterium]|nr:hypothetical protein [Actinomycetota bacterium]
MRSPGTGRKAGPLHASRSFGRRRHRTASRRVGPTPTGADGVVKAALPDLSAPTYAPGGLLDFADFDQG